MNLNLMSYLHCIFLRIEFGCKHALSIWPFDSSLVAFGLHNWIVFSLSELLALAKEIK